MDVNDAFTDTGTSSASSTRVAYIQTGTKSSVATTNPKRRGLTFGEAANKVKRKVAVLNAFRKETGGNIEATNGIEGQSTQPETNSSDIKYENTYKMVPNIDAAFSSTRVEKSLKDLLEAQLQDHIYNPEASPKLACDIAHLAKERMKLLGFVRHKLVTSVLLGENGQQGLETASRCIWNAETDSHATVCFHNASVFAVIMMYGVYFE